MRALLIIGCLLSTPAAADCLTDLSNDCSYEQRWSEMAREVDPYSQVNLLKEQARVAQEAADLAPDDYAPRWSR